MTNKQIPHLEFSRYTAQQQDMLLEFLVKVFELSSKCQYDGLHNANALLPELVGKYFNNYFVQKLYDKLED